MSLAVQVLGERAGGPHVVITGGVHGDEFEPMIALKRLAELLRDRPLRGQVTLVPVANEPAYRLGRRTGDDGLDLARTCPGNAQGSPTERIAHELSRLIRTADAYLDLHTGGLALQVYPLCGYMLHPDSRVLDRQRQMARAFGLPLIWGTDPELPGRTLSVARDHGIPAIYTEFLGGGGALPAIVAAYLRGCLNVLAHLGLIDEPPRPSPHSPLIVEDDRPRSGYLQIQNPAPRDGIFTPSVTLGQRVAQGDPLGHVENPLEAGSEPMLVQADRAGLILTLRTLARVSRGDGLAAILETAGTLPVGSDALARTPPPGVP